MLKITMQSISGVLFLWYGVGTPCLAEDYYTQHAVGWHWYDDPKEEVKAEKVKKAAEKAANEATDKTKDPDVVMAAVRKRVTTALNRAIAEPTVEHVEAYIQLQEQLNDRAEKVSDVWQQVLLKNPALNYALAHPTNSAALKVYQEEQSREKDRALTEFAKQYELFYFYRSTCPYCQRFSSVLIHFATRYGIHIVPITMDGISLPEFPNSPQDSGESAQFNVKMSPAVIAVNHRTQKAYPVVYGLTSETELRENSYKLVTSRVGGGA